MSNADQAPENFDEAEYCRLHNSHHDARFEIVLMGDRGSILGYIAESDIDPGAPARKNRLFVCAVWPYYGNPRIDPNCTEIRFSQIREIRRLDP
jgi:hypothetical protein